MDRKINLCRWRDVVLLGLISYALVFLIASVGAVQVAFGKWAILFSSVHMGVQILLALTGFYCARHLLLFFNVIHKRQLKNIKLSLAYPPITFSIVLCLLLFLPQFDVINFFSDSLFLSYFLGAALLFIILLSLLCAYDSLYSEKRKDKQELVHDEEWITDEEQKNHYRWLMSERPQDECDKDMLGREVYVARIARLFKPIDSEPNRKANHIAIVGPFGIGKTSVWKSVRQQLGDDYIFVPVDGWGRGEGTVAAQIIDEMVAALTNYVDCASIRNVPKEYMAALSGADFKGISTLAKILPLHSHQSPEELIRKIETILLSIGKTMVVVLEDFDRNPQEENIMNEVAGLLDRLRDLRSINFIVCVAPGVKSHLLSRISTYREDLLSFDSREFIEITIELMKCYAKHKKKPIFNDDSQDAKTFAVAMNALIKTPRDAKYALRRAYKAWEIIAGEVNIFDLMAVNVLRYGVPEAFDFMIKNFDTLRRNFPDIEQIVGNFERGFHFSSASQNSSCSEQSNETNRSAGYEEAVVNLVDLLSSSGVNEKNARKLIKMIFPYWNSNDVVGYWLKVQRIAWEQGKIYLDRILTESIANEHINYTDVEFFRGLSSSDEEFVNKLVGSRYWTEKFIIHIISRKLDVIYWVDNFILNNFVKFLVRRFQSGKDIFCNEIYSYESQLPLIIERISAGEDDADVFTRFLDGIPSEGEELFAAIQRSKEYAKTVHQSIGQLQLWIDHKHQLEDYFNRSVSLSEQRKAEIIQFLKELN